MAKHTVAVLMRVNYNGKRTYIKPVWHGAKLKPHCGLLKNGVEVFMPEAIYYLRFIRCEVCLGSSGPSS
jgi:hypothetical protein